MNFRADFIVRNKEGHPVLVVEIKVRESLSKKEAVMVRRNMIAHGFPKSISYFMLLTQDVGFLWQESESQNLAQEPILEFDMRKVVARYLPKIDSNTRLWGDQLELLVLQWLNELTLLSKGVHEEPENSLLQIGLIKSIIGGTVVSEAYL